MLSAFEIVNQKLNCTFTPESQSIQSNEIAFKVGFNIAIHLRPAGAQYVNCTLAWLEQRQFVGLTIEALGAHPVVDMIYKELAQLKPSLPDLSGGSVDLETFK